jgi:hypothetical protein
MDIEKITKSYLASHLKQDRPQTCPGEAQLHDYLNGRLPQELRQKIESHISQCQICLEALIAVNGLNKAKMPKLPKETLLRLKNVIKEQSPRSRLEGFISKPKEKPPGNRFGKWIDKNKWFIGSLLFIALSFFIPRYFLQLLTVGAIMGFKWALEGEGAKKLIMIFRSTHKEREDTEAHKRR